MKPTIMITGATGNTGLPLVQYLSAAGVPIRAMIHSPEKKTTLKMYEGVDVVVGELSDRKSLEGALGGIEKAYLVSPPAQDQVKLQTLFVDVAKSRGVKQIVKLSALGTDPKSPVNLLVWHAVIEEYIRKSGIAYTFLRPHFFMENLLGDIEAVRNDGAIYSPLGETRINAISVLDIAAVAAKALTDDGHEGKTYTLTGPELITYGRIAMTLGNVIGRPVRYVEVPYDAAREGMVKAGMPEWFADDLIRLMKSWAGGMGSIMSQDVERITGKKPLSIREFFTRHRNLFLAAA